MVRLAIQHDTRGSTAIEFALLAPAVFLMIFALIELGCLYWTISSIDFALGRGGRYAMLHGGVSGSQVVKEVRAHLYGIDVNAAAINTSTAAVGSIPYMTIQAQCSFFTLPGVLPPILIARQLQVPLLP